MYLISSIEDRSQAFKGKPFKKVDPLSLLKLGDAERVIVSQRIEYINPPLIDYKPPSEAYLILTDSRVLLVSVQGVNSRVIAIPRQFVVYIIPVILNNEKYIRLIYQKMGKVEELLIKLENVDLFFRLLI